MKRFLKQIIIAGIYGVIFLVTAWGVFNILYTPTCIDGIRNQGEERVDCGGPCPSCDLKKLIAPLIAKKVYFLDSAGNTADVGFQVKNPNLEWGANNLEYQIDFIGADGGVIPGSLYGSTFILPGESKWIIEIAKLVPGRMKELQVSISTSSASWGKLRPYVNETNFVVKDSLYKRLTPPQSGYAETTGIIMNKSGFQVENVQIQGIAYDKNGVIIGLTKTTIFTFHIGESREFRLFWPRPFSKDMKEYKVFVNVNLLDNETFLQKYGQ